MTEEEINIAIAEEMGWTGCILYNVESGKEPRGHPPKQQSCYQGYTELIPQCARDLNACHEMEKTLGDIDNWMLYDKALAEITEGFTFHAAASHRCEAFLRVKGKWKE